MRRANLVREQLASIATPERARASAWFFKTGEGEYGAGDKFIGVAVPDQRRVAREHADLPLDGIADLLSSPIHEERLTALLILVRRFEKADEATRKAVVDFYLAHLDRVDNWDLVDSSAPQILGTWLLNQPARERKRLDKLARSKRLWDRRVAMIATLAFIQAGQADDALRIAELLLTDSHDLIHKATGWMLREIGQKVSLETLRDFLTTHAATMPRTALRYAIEKLSPDERKRWMAHKAR